MFFLFLFFILLLIDGCYPDPTDQLLRQAQMEELEAQSCDPSYPDFCLLPGVSDLDCPDFPYRRFRVLYPDPHGFDGDGDGVGCELDGS